MLLGRGWKAFARAHNLEDGHILRFKLAKDNMLSVKFYGRSGLSNKVWDLPERKQPIYSEISSEIFITYLSCHDTSPRGAWVLCRGLRSPASRRLYFPGNFPSDKARARVEHLVGKFAFGMTNLLGKLVESWTPLASSDGDTIARQFTSFVGEHTHRPTGCCGWYDYNSSEELPDTQEDLFGDGFSGLDVGLEKDGDDDMENVQNDTDHDKSREVHDGDTNDKASPAVSASEGGNA
ncbi:hypothetical protein D1007_29825 [Hordeum vulgare]|nr:hypothetical protein D1007_29825 [Hordeum vulgare]